LSRRYLSFELGGHHYGIDIGQVMEMNRHADYTPVPDAPVHIAGLWNMRGQVVTLFDLARLLGHEPEGACKRTACIILKNSLAEPDYIGLLIDRPGSVVEAGDAMHEPSLSHTGDASRECVRDIVMLKDGLLMVIDPGYLYAL